MDIFTQYFFSTAIKLAYEIVHSSYSAIIIRTAYNFIASKFNLPTIDYWVMFFVCWSIIEIKDLILGKINISIKDNNRNIEVEEE